MTQLTHDTDVQYPHPTEVGDEHLRNEFASPLQMQEREAKTDLTQTRHSNEESMFRSVPSISARTEKPSSMLNERESHQGLENEMFMSALQVQREAKFGDPKIRRESEFR